MRARGQGTHGWGARKKHKKSGHRGGSGMAGKGKKENQKKTLITKLYGNKYFGKKGITSKKTERDKRKRINLFTIDKNVESFGKKTAKGWEVNLENYKILGCKDDLKNKLIIKTNSASESAIKKVQKNGGEIIIKENRKEEKKETS